MGAEPTGAYRANAVEAEHDAVLGAACAEVDGEDGFPVVLVGGIDQDLDDGELVRAGTESYELPAKAIS